MDDLLRLLKRVEKPARYLGGEVNEIVKPDARVRVAVAFPDVYEMAMSNLALHILYSVLNAEPDIACERIYAPWPDFERALRGAGMPLMSLETKRPMRDFDVVGFTLQYELSYGMVVSMLDAGGVPIWAKERGERDPIVVAGGPGAFNPEPIADFLDAVVVGDGEEVVLDVVRVVRGMAGRSRAEKLAALAAVEGVYVPRFFEVDYHDDGRLRAIRHVGPGPSVIKKRVVADIDKAPYPERPLVPNIDAIHDRVPIELQRGCTRACRFCQAGFIARPTRQRSPEQVFRLADVGLRSTGHESIGFLSLSAGDYGCLNPLLEDFFKQYDAEKVSVGLPSLRTETLTPRLASEIRRVRKSGFTIAPEAGSARMRRVINKGNDEQDLLNAVRATFGAGWDLIKMYFMIGLPTETDVDVAAIAELAKHALDVGRAMNRRARVTAAVSTFVPKPMTPFQWCRQIGLEETREKQSLLMQAFRGSRVEFKRHDAPQTLIEGVLSRGDRRVGRAILLMHERGGRFDGWSDHFDLGAWRQAMADAGLDIAWYLRDRDKDEVLPWDHIDSRMPKQFFWDDYQAGLAEAFVDDCALAAKPRCYDCGVCDHKVVKNRIHKEAAYNVSLPVVAAEPVPYAYAASDLVQTPSSSVSPCLRGESSSSSSRRMVARIRYGKIGRGALFGHLDTMTVMLRAMKRAGIPCGLSDGFHPKPKASFSPALALGVESRAEIVEVELERPMRALEVFERLARETLDGFPIYDVQVVPAPTPPLEKIIDSVEYLFTFPDPKGLAARVAAFHAAPTFEFVRRREDREKRFDLKRAISAMEAVSDIEARVSIVNRLDGMPKPSEILSAVFGVSESAQAGIDIMKERVTFIRESPREHRREARF